MKVILNKEYSFLKEFINTIPNEFETSGEIIYKGRNTLKNFKIEDKIYTVKAFKKPNIVNKIAYKYFRKSKACRSFLYAMELIKKGISTPKPVAFIEEGGLLFGKSYYICEYQQNDFTLRELQDDNFPNKEKIFRQFIEFTINLHKQNVLHLDYSPGNVIINKVNENYSFSLVDINRMVFQEIDLETSLRYLAKIWASDYMYPIIEKKYAELWTCKEDEVISIFKNYDQLHKEKTLRKRRLQKKMGKKLGKL